MPERSIVLTGGRGFLGWHTRAALREEGVDARMLSVGDFFDLDAASSVVSGSTRVIHLAGVNRGTDGEVRDGNIQFARQLAQALLRAPQAPAEIVFANSTQADNGSVYGDAKQAAAGILSEAAAQMGAEFSDLHLPNLFGEHGRPFYNAVTATFSHLLADGQEPEVKDDKELSLLHAQDAADLLIGAVDLSRARELQVAETVSGLLRRLSRMAETYRRGEIPDVSTPFDRNLFNTYRSYTFPGQAPVRLARHADARGSFFEVIRSHGGPGQSSFSTTVPGITRGDHFHRRKIERFTVLSGTATIALRKIFTDEVFSFEVTGDEPVAVDMPTMWSHNITNVGADTLYTSFWTNDIFNSQAPDTIPEAVHA
ncbi:NAD-dependent epimerase/dehydratase family protein [Okibacterium endophyticum]